MSDVVCTMFEGDYSIGVAALLNSLQRNGFAGTVVCGYRGAEPWWAGTVDAWTPMTVELLHLDTGRHFAAYKPQLLETIAARRDVRRIHYIDPDIVVTAPWPYISRWADGGVALVEDINGSMPEFDPFRLQWRDHLEGHGMQVARKLSTYYNSGYVGLDVALIRFLSVWRAIIGQAEAAVGPLGLKHGSPTSLFHSVDQDAMNMALELSDVPLHGAAPSAMGFDSHGPLLLAHAIGHPKPWRAKPLREAAAGRPPSRAARAWHAYAHHPVPAMPMLDLQRRHREVKLALAISRLYRR